jgi:hypothetical protein
LSEPEVGGRSSFLASCSKRFSAATIFICLAASGSFTARRQSCCHRQKARYSQDLEALRDTLQKEQKRVQAQIDKSVFVTRAHFETEFAAMKDVFKHLAEVRLLLNALRPHMSVEPKDEGESEKLTSLSGRLKRLQIVYDDFLETFEARNPLYPRELYTALQECARAATKEINSVLIAKRETTLTLFRSRFRTAFLPPIQVYSNLGSHSGGLTQRPAT